ncbi:MAG TPA: PKD domain-containing protein [Gammaproteobacteria bacterium]|nr:PKD domain-containing protein [Gammaproteobacteria bacterium]
MNNTNRFRQLRVRGSSALLLALLTGPFVALPVLAAPYELVDLGVDIAPADINNQGTIVGTRRTASGSVAFRWLSGGQLEDIPGATAAHAVNEANQVTGTALTGAFLFDGTGTPQEWDGYGGYGINEAGQIAGNHELANPYRAAPLPLDPAIYTPDQWADLGIATVYPRGTRQGVYADLYTLRDINDSGYAVGSRSRYGLAGSSAILTTPTFAGVTYLSIPNGGSAAAINNQNVIVGTTGSNSSAGEYAHAFLYDYNTGSLQDLGTLHGGLTSGAADINDLNQVVGTSWLVTQLTSLYDPTQYHAFLWENGAITDLNDLITPGSGWILTAATAINDEGGIVGTGLVDGQVHGFLLMSSQAQPPSPPPVQAEPPLAMASADVTSGRVALTVNFSSSGSSDPDGSIAAYSWDFGDSSPLASEANPTHVYTVPGTYIAMLTVTDDQGLTASAQVDISARKWKGGWKR